MKNAATVRGGPVWWWRAMVRARRGIALSVSCVFLLLALLASASRVRAQQGFLRFEQVDDACLDVDVLVRSTQRYLDGGAPVSGVRIVLSASGNTASFAVMHRGEVVARRSFSVLPESCPARRKALGLAMALSLESAGLGRMVSPDAGESDVDPRSPATATAPASVAAEGADREGGPSSPAPGNSRGRSPRGRRQKWVRRARVGHVATSSQPPAEEGKPPVSTELVKVTPAAPVTEVSVGQDGPAPELSIFATGGLLVGLRPYYGGALQLGLSVRLSSVELELAGLWAPAVGHKFDPSDGGRAIVSVYGGRLLGCVLHGFSSLSLGVCAGTMGGRVLASGEGFEVAEREASRFWLSADLAGRAYLPVSAGLSVTVQVDVLLHVLRPVLVVEGEGGGQQDSGIAAILASLGLRWTFF